MPASKPQEGADLHFDDPSSDSHRIGAPRPGKDFAYWIRVASWVSVIFAPAMLLIAIIADNILGSAHRWSLAYEILSDFRALEIVALLIGVLALIGSLTAKMHSVAKRSAVGIVIAIVSQVFLYAGLLGAALGGGSH
jgi:hypothetical protein